MSRVIRFRRAHFIDEDKTQFSHFSAWGSKMEGRFKAEFTSPWFNSEAVFTEDQQYLGVDKNGKDYYEGDIIKYQHSPQSGEYIGPIVYKESSAAFWIVTQDHAGFALLGQQKIVEVIGDIFRNPELLRV